MQTFQIFKKQKGYNWTVTDIVFIVLFASLFILIAKDKYIGNLEWELFEEIWKGIAMLATLFLMGLGITSWLRYEPKNGSISGNLILDFDKIEIDEKTYFLSDIKSIKIYAQDYEMRRKFKIHSYDGDLSNGIDNYISLYLNSGEKTKCYFYLRDNGDFMIAKNEVIHYYQQGKISFDGLVNVLGIETKDIQNFREQLTQTKID